MDGNNIFLLYTIRMRGSEAQESWIPVEYITSRNLIIVPGVYLHLKY